MSTLPDPHALRKPARPNTLRGYMVALVISCVFMTACMYIGGAFAPQADESAVQTTQKYAFQQLIPQELGTPVQVTLTHGNETFTLETDGTTFHIVGEDAVLDEDRAGQLLSRGASILSREQFNGEFADFGLSEPALTAKFVYADGSSLTLFLGNAPATGEGRYARVEGDDRIHLVNVSLYSGLCVDRYSLMAIPDFTEVYTAQTLKTVTISSPGTELIAIRRVEEQNPFNTVAEFVTPVRYPANSERTAQLFLSLAEIQPEKVLATEAEKAGYGFTQPIAELWLEGPEKTLKLCFGSSEAGLAMIIEGDPLIYAVSADALDFLPRATVPYLAEQLPGLVAVAQVETLTMKKGEEVYEIFIGGNANGSQKLINGKPLAQEDLLQLYQKAIGLLIDRYAPNQSAGESCAELIYTFMDGSTWSLSFLDYDKEYYIVDRDGATCFLIARSKVDALFDAAKELNGAE